MNAAPLLLLTLANALPGQDTSQDTAPDVPEWRAEADELEAQGRFDHAVIRIEQRVDDAPDDAGARRALARALERFVDEGGGSWYAMQDARDAWERALAIEPFDLDALHSAAWVRLRLAEYPEAEALALRGVGTSLVQGGEVSERFLTLACRARSGALQGVGRTDVGAWANEVASAWELFLNARDLAPDEAELDAVEAGLLDVLGVPELAVERLRTAIPRHPGSAELHGLLVDLFLRDGMEARLAELYDNWTGSSTGDDATLTWYAAYVERRHGDRLQRERRFDAALQSYAFCAAAAAASAEAEPEYLATTLELRQQAEVSSIFCLIEKGALDAAQERLLALLRERPEMRAYPDGLSRSAMNAAARMGEERVARSRFADAAAVARVLVEVDPGDGRWWNNLGFLLREYATQIEGGAFEDVEDPEALARETFRESWRAYLRAAELSPEDARVVNDAALIQVYHVREELERALEFLWQAIHTGEAQLQALGPDPPELERFPIAQAVGDAYENLGYLYYHVLGEPERSREHWMASMATDSGDRSYFQRYLDAIDGTGDPVPERDSSGFVQGPEEGPLETAEIAWEASFEEARAIAAAEERPLVLYNKGEGLGLAVPYLDRLVRSPRFAENTAGAVLVVADALRHTFVDRRRDGRRLACPKWGVITCTEHIAARDEFVAWYREAHGADPGESEEGLFVQALGNAAPAMLSSSDVFQEELPGLPAAPASSASPVGAGAATPAAELVGVRSRAARALVEARLFTPHRIEPGAADPRRPLVEALAQDDHPASRELLLALAYQDADPALAALALFAWPRGLDDAAAKHVLRWSGWGEARAAAEAVLARDPDELARRRALAGILTDR